MDTKGNCQIQIQEAAFWGSSAQDVFQAIMSNVFGDIEGIKAVVDEIL